jgi:hypothetical protein
MKKSFIIITLVAFTFSFACKKDKDPSPYDTKYTNESTEESKANVEQNAIDFVDQLDALSSATGIEVLMNLNNLQSGTTYAIGSKPAFAPFMQLASVKDKSSATNVFATIKSTEEAFVVDPVSFTEIFDSLAGKYTYNFLTGEFDRTDFTDQIVFEFPGKETDITNTATLTIDNFTVSEITDPIENWPEGLAPELPASIDADLRYNGTSVAGMTFDASYQSNGMPTKVTVELRVDDFTLRTTAVHSPFTSASWTNTLKFKSDILFETYMAAKGNWSEQNIDDNVTETTYTDQYGSYTETEVNIENIINNANAHLILMNLKVVGQVNIKGLASVMKPLEENETLSDQEIAQAEVDAINANCKLVVIYRDSNTKIADAEAYVYEEYDSYWDETYYYPEIRFVYADGSFVSAEVFATDQMDGFYTSLNAFIDQLNDEYDLTLQHVDPNQAK